MHEYRIYTLNDNNRIAGPAEVIACDDDMEAIARAKRLLDGHDVEIWRGDRVVIRLKPTDDK
jgi:translation initiation factor IF-1